VNSENGVSVTMSEFGLRKITALSEGFTLLPLASSDAGLQEHF
jgi:hypothetical protein